MSRGGVLFMDVSGFAINNVCLGRPPHPFHSVRMKALSHLGKSADETITGDVLTWGVLDKLSVSWGNDTVISFESLVVGWFYVWDIGAGNFIVQNDIGESTIYTAKTLSALGISWDVLQSTQFAISITAAFEPDVFLVAGRINKECSVYTVGYVWGEADEYLAGTQHIVFDVLLDYPVDAIQGQDIIFRFEPGVPDGIVDVLLAKANKLEAFGDYPVDIIVGDSGRVSERQITIRDGIQAFIVQYLIPRLLVAKISAASDPVFEPWMLWNVFKWLGQRSVVVTRERVFDLSPWWG